MGIIVTSIQKGRSATFSVENKMCSKVSDRIGIVTIEEVGRIESNFRKGKSAVIPCITSCGKCEYCRKRMYWYCQE